MSARLDAELSAELAAWEARGLRRALPDPEGSAALDDFASNDYLSLARDPRVIAAAREALERFGAGGRAARLLGGGSPLDRQAERAAAEWLRAEAALLFPSGYQANLGVVTALAGRGDALVCDELDHASLIDAARLSRARVLVFRHGDPEHAEHCLRLARGARRRLVVVESVYSMDGDAAPLLELERSCARHEASLVVDEAHAAGLVGREGAGAWSRVDPDGTLGREGALAARIVTGGKALGASGAFVVGSGALCRQILQHARSFVFTTAPPPATAGALLAAIGIVRAADEARARVLGLARTLALELDAPEPAAAIVPFFAGSSERALELAAALSRSGFDVRGVRPPTVAPGSARLRLVCHAHNDEGRTRALAAALLAAARARTPEPIEITAPARPALFVAGTDTGVGKTVVASLLARAAARRGGATYWKPVQTGSDDDTAAVGSLLSGSSAATRPPRHVFELAASPEHAAAAAGARVELEGLRADLADARRSSASGTLIVELAGGLLVPYDDRTTQLDWLALERAALVLVARSGLGTLNHTLLSLEALEARALRPRALFLVGPAHAANRATLAARAPGLAIHEVAVFEPLDADALDRWLEAHDLSALFDEASPR